MKQEPVPVVPVVPVPAFPRYIVKMAGGQVIDIR